MINFSFIKLPTLNIELISHFPQPLYFITIDIFHQNKWSLSVFVTALHARNGLKCGIKGSSFGTQQNNQVRGESLDLMKYVDSEFDGSSLFPDNPDKREFAEELLSYTHTFYKTVTSSFKGDATEAGNALDHIENALSKYDVGPFFLGQFSLVDIAYAPFIERFEAYLLEVKNYDISGGGPKLAAWTKWRVCCTVKNIKSADLQETNNIDAYKQTCRDRKELVESYKKRFLSAD